MPGTPEAVVYERVTSAAKDQLDTLRDLRARAGAILSAASLSTAFIGSQALSDHRSFSALGWIGVVAYVAVGALNIAILWPWPWLSALDPRIMLHDIDAENLSEADLHRFLATVIDDNIDWNQRLLGRLFWAFRMCCAALVISVVSWLALLASR